VHDTWCGSRKQEREVVPRDAAHPRKTEIGAGGMAVDDLTRRIILFGQCTLDHIDKLIFPAGLADNTQNVSLFQEATQQFEECLKIDPRSAWAHHNLGLVLQHQGKFAEAVAHFKKAIELNPLYGLPRQGLGMRLVTLGKANEAVPQLRQAVWLRPDSVVPLNALAWILATDPDSNLRNADEAIRAYLNPHSVNTLFA
jgi:tetratricopeptide (TPR) repeat protein